MISILWVIFVFIRKQNTRIFTVLVRNVFYLIEVGWNGNQYYNSNLKFEFHNKICIHKPTNVIFSYKESKQTTNFDSYSKLKFSLIQFAFIMKSEFCNVLTLVYYKASSVCFISVHFFTRKCPLTMIRE